MSSSSPKLDEAEDDLAFLEEDDAPPGTSKPAKDDSLIFWTHAYDAKTDKPLVNIIHTALANNLAVAGGGIDQALLLPGRKDNILPFLITFSQTKGKKGCPAISPMYLPRTNLLTCVMVLEMDECKLPSVAMDGCAIYNYFDNEEEMMRFFVIVEQCVDEEDSQYLHKLTFENPPPTFDAIANSQQYIKIHSKLQQKTEKKLSDFLITNFLMPKDTPRKNLPLLEEERVQVPEPDTILWVNHITKGYYANECYALSATKIHSKRRTCFAPMFVHGRPFLLDMTGIDLLSPQCLTLFRWITDLDKYFCYPSKIKKQPCLNMSEYATWTKHADQRLFALRSLVDQSSHHHHHHP